MSWPSLAVVLTNVPKELGTVDIWKAFKEEGSIVSIDIWEDSHGGRGTKAKVRFK
jgi:RNA-dependent RNA polymerase